MRERKCKIKGGIQEAPIFRGEMEEERPIGSQKEVDRKKRRRSQGREDCRKKGVQL